MSASKKNVKFLISADIQKLSIKKNIKFLTKVVWKRHTNKTETSMTKHQHGYSIFNQKLYLQINLVYDEDKNCYEDKNTEFVVVIQFQGKVKSGGYIKYNIAQVVNNNWKGHQQNIYLTQCPDPNAFIQLSFDYQLQGQQLEESMSVLNASSRDLNMSRIDFNDDKLSLQMDRINQTVNKLQGLATKVKNKQNVSQKKLPELITKLQIMEGQRDTLKNTVLRLEESLKARQTQFKQQRKQLTKQIASLEKQLQKKTKDIRSKELIEDEQNHYKNMYEEALQQIQQLKSMNMKQASMGLSLGIRNNLEDVQQIANFNSSFHSEDQSEAGNARKKQKQSSIKKQIQQLKMQNSQLQTNVAGMSYKLATLFNASYEYGGAKLLDHLQTSIGLTQELNNNTN